MKKIGEVIGPIYQKLLARGIRSKFSVNLDVQDPFLDVGDLEVVESFFNKQIRRAVKDLPKNGKICLIQKRDENIIRFSVRDSGPNFTEQQKADLRKEGLEVRSRYGFDNIVSIVMELR